MSVERDGNPSFSGQNEASRETLKGQAELAREKAQELFRGNYAPDVIDDFLRYLVEDSVLPKDEIEAIAQLLSSH
jgi:hypothetical protein